MYEDLVFGCKNEIGAANVSPDDPKAKRFFHSGALALFAELEKHNTEALWRRYLNRDLICQRRLKQVGAQAGAP